MKKMLAILGALMISSTVFAEDKIVIQREYTVYDVTKNDAELMKMLKQIPNIDPNLVLEQGFFALGSQCAIDQNKNKDCEQDLLVVAGYEKRPGGFYVTCINKHNGIPVSKKSDGGVYLKSFMTKCM